MPVAGEMLAAKKVSPDKVAAVRLDDIRVLPVQFDAQGLRRR